MKKKTFKRAGVAVLSMAMLLSMGAVAATSASAAEGDAKTIVVSQIKAEGTKGDYVISNVKVYQVAKQDADTKVWSWNTPFTTIDSTDFSDLSSLSAEKVNELARSLKNQLTTSASSVAKYLVLDKDATVEDEKIKSEDISGVIHDNDAADGAKVNGTAYYLVVPTSADTDVIIQPALVTITSTGDYVTTVTSKANPLPFEKKITSTTSGELSSTGDTSVGTKGSEVGYTITTKLPKYADDVTGEKTKPFIIRDDPSSGITINSDLTEAGANVVVKFGDTVVYTNGAATAEGTVAKDSIDSVNHLPATAQSVEVTSPAGTDGFTVTIPGYVVQANEGADVTVTFKATVSDSAVLGSATVADYDTAHQGQTGNPNTATLTYGNNFSTGGYADPDGGDDKPDEPTTPNKKDTVTTYVGEIDLDKVEKDSEAIKLAGAVFTLKKGSTDISPTKVVNGVVYGIYTYTYTDTDTSQVISKTVYKNGDKYYTITASTVTEDTDAASNAPTQVTTFTTDNSGKFDFGYLAPGTYTLHETTAPAGHRTVSDITFTVKAKEETDTEFNTYQVSLTTSDTVSLTDTNSSTHGDYTIVVKDPKADSLPGTGGMGTVLFTVGGAAVVLLAGFLFVVYMKKRKTEE